MIEDPYKYLPLIMAVGFALYGFYKLWWPIIYQFVHGEKYYENSDSNE
jgi:hypothetical protein